MSNPATSATSAKKAAASAAAPATIVVATDFSEDAACAVGWATEIARKHGSRIKLVHACAAQSMPAPEFVPLPPQYYEEVHGDAKRRLEEEAARVRAAGVEAESELLLSFPTAAILDVARRSEARLIVAGTRGRTGWRRMLLGSTAAHLVRESVCPVLTVHCCDTAQPRPIRTILVPTDFSEDAALAAGAAARWLCEAGDGHRLVLLHAYRVPAEAMHLPGAILMEAIREGCESARRALDELAAELRQPGLTVETMAFEGYPPDVILEQAPGVGADLIAMGTHGRSGLGRMMLGSTAERVIATAPCPVLTVRRA